MAVGSAMNNLLTMDEAANFRHIQIDPVRMGLIEETGVRQNRAAGEVQAGSAGRMDRSTHDHSTERQPWD
jgi:hypothetical protein